MKIFRRAACERAPRRLSAQMRTHICCADESSRISLGHKKQEGRDCDPLVFCGGESEIRTHGTVLAFTRFPVVRLRPAQPSLHIDLTIIPQENIKIKSFFKKIFEKLNYFIFSRMISSKIFGFALPPLAPIALPMIDLSAKLLPRL